MTKEMQWLKLTDAITTNAVYLNFALITRIEPHEKGGSRCDFRWWVKETPEQIFDLLGLGPWEGKPKP